MATRLTLLQPLEGRITLSEDHEGWSVELANGDHALGDEERIATGIYEARGRSTTALADTGVTFSLEVYIFDSAGGELRAVRTTDAKFVST